jgi:uncharacterized protein (TIRG00374 family)
MRQAATWAAGAVASGVFLWLAVREVDLGDVGDALDAASYWSLLPALAAVAAANWLRALRWQALFEARSRPPLGPLANAMLIGLFFNCVLPARAGEAARVVALWRETGTSRVESLATAFAERVYDVLVLLVLLFVAAPLLPSVSWLGKAAVLAGALAVAIAATVGVLLVYRERPLLRLLGRALSPERAEVTAASLVRGLASFRQPAVAARALALTTGSWLLLALSAWLLLLGFHLGVGFGAAFLATIATTLVLVIPAAPAGIGQFEAASVAALAVFGVDASAALSYGIVLHALNVVPYLVAGYLALQRHALAVRRRRVAF